MVKICLSQDLELEDNQMLREAREVQNIGLALAAAHVTSRNVALAQPQDSAPSMFVGSRNDQKATLMATETLQVLDSHNLTRP